MAYAPPGLFTIITYQADSFVFIIIGSLMAFGIAAVLSFLFGIPAEENTVSAPASVESKSTVKPASTEIAITAPIKGKVIPLTQVPDAAFASEEMGKGVGIEPCEGKVYAPFDGTVEMLFDTKHAIGLTSKDGVGMLIHVGMDTVELNGQYFTAHVNSGDPIKKGQLLIEFDMAEIAKKYPLVTPVIVTNFDDYASVDGVPCNNADLNTTVIKVK